MSIQLSVDVTKINKDYLVEGKKGKYMTLSLKKNKDGKDQYDNDGFIVQVIPKDKREEGLRGPIVGNYKEYLDDYIAPAKAAAFKKPEQVEDKDDDLPF
jgi:hypothetical protein